MAPILSNLHTQENSSPSLYDHSIDYNLVYKPAESSYIEIQPDSDGLGTIREGFLCPEQVEEWLLSDFAIPGNAEGPKNIYQGRLRLLLSTSRTSKEDKTVVVPWSQLTFQRICEKLSAPQHIIDILTHSIPHVACLPHKYDTDCNNGGHSDAYLFKVGIGGSGFYTILSTYHRATATTNAVILAQTEVFDFEGLLVLLRSNSRLAPQPMFVPVMLMQLLLIMTMTRMQHQSQRLDYTQQSLGQHTFSSKPREDPFRADFEMITPALNGTARTVSMIEMRTKARQELLKKCLTYIEVTAQNVMPEIKSLLDKSHDAIRQHLDMTMNSNHNILLQVAFEQKRIQIQLDVIYNFTHQKSNQVVIALTDESRRIAEHAQQDAAAMKAIAVLTMAFLPGTFTAALFTTPFFDWEVSQYRFIVKDRFWCYWVTTIPLTFVVFLVWISWYQWQRRITQRDSARRGNESNKVA